MTFYDRVNELCRDRGISITALALALGFSKGTPSNWKTMTKPPRAENVKKVADYFGVSVDYLHGKEEKPSVNEDSVLDARIMELWAQLDDNAREDALKYIEYLKAKK